MRGIASIALRMISAYVVNECTKIRKRHDISALCLEIIHCLPVCSLLL
jgi:hypothetical protein